MGKRGFTGSRVVTAVCVALERNNTRGRIQGTGSVAKERIEAVGRVVIAGGVGSPSRFL